MRFLWAMDLKQTSLQLAYDERTSTPVTNGSPLCSNALLALIMQADASKIP